MVAAAAARNGHTVLHVDNNDFYGGDWAAFTFDGIQNWIEKEQENIITPEEVADTVKEALKEGEKLLPLNTRLSSIRNVQQEWHIAEEEEEEKEKLEENEDEKSFDQVEDDVEVRDQQPAKTEQSTQTEEEKRWTKSKILAESRKFNLDLTPKLFFSRGAMVELLISSNISRYTEFKAVSRVLTVIQGELEHVPSSRADVFATKHVSVVEKRILMKFLTFCMDYQNFPEKTESFKSKSFLEFLKKEKLTENLIHFVMHSIAMVKDDATCLQGLEKTQKFLQSLGRFGNTPFLWSMYGSGELPQAFCRLCAVFGGTYYLGKYFKYFNTSLFKYFQYYSCVSQLLMKSSFGQIRE